MLPRAVTKMDDDDDDDDNQFNCSEKQNDASK